STFLCREHEQIYEIGELGESLNPPQLRARALRIEEEYPSSALRYTIRHLMENGWFGFKAGNQAIVIAENSGFVSEYLQKTSFIMLFRRDLIAQSVSRVKAKMTSRFHFRQPERKAIGMGDYSQSQIGQSMYAILRSLKSLDAYVRATERPWTKIFYEDFSDGDFR